MRSALATVLLFVLAGCADTVNPTAGGLRLVVEGDDTPPVISSISATPDGIWPPDHKLKVEVTVTVVVTDDSGDPARLLQGLAPKGGRRRRRVAAAAQRGWRELPLEDRCALMRKLAETNGGSFVGLNSAR